MLRKSLAVMALVLLTACGGDPEPREPAPSPTVTPPEMPAQANEESDEGAAAFMNHFVRTLNYASATGQVAELERLSAEECITCQNYITLYADTYRKGGYFRDSPWDLSEIDIERHPDEVVGFAQVTAPAGVYRTDPEAEEKTGQSEDFSAVLVAQWTSDSWHLIELGRREQ